MINSTTVHSARSMLSLLLMGKNLLYLHPHGTATLWPTEIPPLYVWLKSCNSYSSQVSSGEWMAFWSLTSGQLWLLGSPPWSLASLSGYSQSLHFLTSVCSCLSLCTFLRSESSSSLSTHMYWLPLLLGFHDWLWRVAPRTVPFILASRSPRCRSTDIIFILCLKTSKHQIITLYPYKVLLSGEGPLLCCVVRVEREAVRPFPWASCDILMGDNALIRAFTWTTSSPPWIPISLHSSTSYCFFPLRMPLSVLLWDRYQQRMMLIQTPGVCPPASILHKTPCLCVHVTMTK